MATRDIPDCLPQRICGGARYSLCYWCRASISRYGPPESSYTSARVEQLSPRNCSANVCTWSRFGCMNCVNKRHSMVRRRLHISPSPSSGPWTGDVYSRAQSAWVCRHISGYPVRPPESSSGRVGMARDSTPAVSRIGAQSSAGSVRQQKGARAIRTGR